MSSATKETEIMWDAINRLQAGVMELTAYAERLAQSLEAMEARLAKVEPAKTHHRNCACHQCLDLRYGWVEPNLPQEADDPPTPVTRCSLCGEEYCPYC